MSFDERLLVPDAKSRASTSATRRPRSAASRATPAPVMPPPTMRTSKRSFARRLRLRARVVGSKPAIGAFPAVPADGARQ